MSGVEVLGAVASVIAVFTLGVQVAARTFTTISTITNATKEEARLKGKIGELLKLLERVNDHVQGGATHQAEHWTSLQEAVTKCTKALDECDSKLKDMYGYGSMRGRFRGFYVGLKTAIKESTLRKIEDEVDLQQGQLSANLAVANINFSVSTNDQVSSIRKSLKDNFSSMETALDEQNKQRIVESSEYLAIQNTNHLELLTLGSKLRGEVGENAQLLLARIEAQPNLEALLLMLKRFQDQNDALTAQIQGHQASVALNDVERIRLNFGELLHFSLGYGPITLQETKDRISAYLIEIVDLMSMDRAIGILDLKGKRKADEQVNTDKTDNAAPVKRLRALLDDPDIVQMSKVATTLGVIPGHRTIAKQRQHHSSKRKGFVLDIQTFIRQLETSGSATTDDDKVQEILAKVSFYPSTSDWGIKLITTVQQTIYRNGKQSISTTLTYRGIIPVDSSIFRFIEDGDYLGVRRLIEESKVGVNDADHEGRMLIHAACYSCDSYGSPSQDIVRYLMEKGADLNCISDVNGLLMSPLGALVHMDRGWPASLILIKRFLDNGSDPTFDESLVEIAEQDSELLTRILTHEEISIDLNEIYPNSLQSTGMEHTILGQVVAVTSMGSGHDLVNSVQVLLDHGADPSITNAAGQTCLHLVYWRKADDAADDSEDEDGVYGFKMIPDIESVTVSLLHGHLPKEDKSVRVRPDLSAKDSNGMTFSDYALTFENGQFWGAWVVALDASRISPLAVMRESLHCNAILMSLHILGRLARLLPPLPIDDKKERIYFLGRYMARQYNQWLRTDAGKEWIASPSNVVVDFASLFREPSANEMNRLINDYALYLDELSAPEGEDESESDNSAMSSAGDVFEINDHQIWADGVARSFIDTNAVGDDNGNSTSPHFISNNYTTRVSYSLSTADQDELLNSHHLWEDSMDTSP